MVFALLFSFTQNERTGLEPLTLGLCVHPLELKVH